MFLTFNLFVIVIINLINISISVKLSLLALVFITLMPATRSVSYSETYFVNFVSNNLINYNVSLSLNNLYNFGFLLAMVLIIQIVSGLILSIHYSNLGFYTIVLILKEISCGWLFRFMHSMNCSLVHLLLCIHILRGVYYNSFMLTPNIWLSGLLLYILIVVVSFLGYVLPFGQMSYWGATVITNIVALIPNLMEWLLGNFVMSLITLKRFFLFHFILGLVVIVLMLVHIIYLHKLGSTNPLYYNSIKITFFPYYYSKDVFCIMVVLVILSIMYLNYVELSHSDNNVEVNQLVTPLHIVPEWYFLSFYTVLKAINSKVGGILIMISFFILLFNIVVTNYTNIHVWSLNSLFIMMYWLNLYLIFMFIGSKLPLAIYLYCSKLFILLIYYNIYNSNRSFSIYLNYNPYFTINGYSLYFSFWNIIFIVQYAIINTNIENNESVINNYILIVFIIISEIILFLSFFGILFNYYSMYIYINNFHLYYVGLLILCHASLLSNVYVLFILSYCFITLQILEYRNMTLVLNYNNFSSLFYVLTTLHLLHILVGVYMLIHVYFNESVVYTLSELSQKYIVLQSYRQMEYSIFMNVYWNFVEFLWLLIFFVYSYFNLSKEYGSLNHKVIGLNYFNLSVLFGLIATIYSICIRVELMSTGNRIIFEGNNFIYNFIISLHGLMMIFYFVMPIVFASLGNTFVPINLNTPELKLAKLNNLSLIFFAFSFIILINASILEFGIGVGWTLYPPLSTYSINLSKLSLELTLFALVFNGLASLLSSINFFISLFYMINIIEVTKVPLFVISILLSSYMLILSLPALTCGIISLILDIALNTILLDPSFNGDPIFYQHLFWFFGHPEVYIMIVPSFGMLNNYIQIITSKIVFGFVTMNLALVGITFLGFVVWAHHMYSVGMESDSRAYFTATTIMISIPTGTKIFNWLCSNYTNYTIFCNNNIFVLFFILIFVIGGSSGVMLGNSGIDIMLHDTYYVVAHFHQVLAIASVLTILLCVLMYLELFYVISVFKNTNISNINLLFTTLFININLLFTNLLFVGFGVMPRRIPEYSDEAVIWNYLASINSISILVLLILYLL